MAQVPPSGRLRDSIELTLTQAKFDTLPAFHTRPPGSSKWILLSQALLYFQVTFVRIISIFDLLLSFFALKLPLFVRMLLPKNTQSFKMP